MGRVYAVASGKGGVGKTTTVANLGAVLAEGGHETVVVDADLGMGNLAGALGVDVDAGPTLHDVLSGTAGAAEALRETSTGLSVLPASDDLDDFGPADPANLAAVVDDLDAAFVLIDTSAGLSHDSVEPLRIADEVLLVSTPERGALGDTAKTREVADRFGTTVAGAVLTRVVRGSTDEGEETQFSDSRLEAVDSEESPRKTGEAGDSEGRRSSDSRPEADDSEESPFPSADAEAIAAAADRLGVTIRGAIAEDAAVSVAAEAGEPLVVAAPRAPATDAYRRLAADLAGDSSLVSAADSTADDPATGEREDAQTAADTPTDDGDDSTTDGSEAAATDEGERTGFLRWLLG